jgi:CRISPR-associated endonuclease/helicase Cas3
MINRLTYAAHTPADHQIGVWHELKEHLEAVADITASKTQKLKATKLGYYSGLWHDLGKYNPAFQDFLPGQCVKPPRFNRGI